MDQYAAFRSQMGSPLVTMSPHTPNTQVCLFPGSLLQGRGEMGSSAAPAFCRSESVSICRTFLHRAHAWFAFQAAPGQQDGGGGGGGQLSEEGSASLGAVLHKSDDLQKRLRALLQQTDEFFKPEDAEAAYAGSAPATSHIQMGEQQWQTVATDSFEGTDWKPDQVVARVNAAPMWRSYHQRPTLEAVREVCLPCFSFPPPTPVP